MAEQNAKRLVADPERQQAAGAWLQDHGARMDDYGFFGVLSHRKEGTVVLRRDTGELAGYLDLHL
jgi:hypothetical protein